MSVEHTDTTASDVDDRSDVVPEGGFAPIGDLDDGPAVVTMPPPPGAWAALADGAASDDAARADGDFPPALAGSASDAADDPKLEIADSTDTEPTGETTAFGGSSDSGVILFGEGAATATSGPWVSDDDADLILPIEPARLAPWSAVAPAPPDTVRDLEPVSDDADGGSGATAIDASEDHVEGVDLPDAVAVAALVTDRLCRSLGPLAAKVSAFLDDESSHFSTGWLPGGVVCLAGSELVGVLDDTRVDSFGASIELGAPHHIPMGLGIPIHLIENSSHVTSLGDIGITAVSGRLEIGVTFEAIVDDVAAELNERMGRFAEAVERLLAEQGVSLAEVTLDAAGGIRIDVDRG